MVPPRTRVRKHKARARAAATEPTEQPNNSVEYAGVSRQKKKRLDKYITSKLKKEENLRLIRELEKNRIDTSLLQSSKDLGRRREYRREAAKNALKRQSAGLPFDEDALFEPTSVHLRSDATQPSSLDQNFGSGLKRPPENDEAGNVIITTRKRKRQTGKSKQHIERPKETFSDWEGFSSPESLENSDVQSSIDEGENGDYTGTSDEDSESEALGSTDGSEGDTDEESSSGYDEGLDDEKKQARIASFKEWAAQQMNQTIGFQPSTNLMNNGEVSTRNTVINPILSSNQSNLDSDSSVRREHVFNVTVNRKPSVESARSELPVVAEEQRIMEAVQSHDVVFLCGATGSGKTTQVPQFLFEAGYGDPRGSNTGMIGVTQPRRIAAVSMAKRVAEELGDSSDKVSHQIRFDSTVSSKTAIKFMTDGILFREVSADFLLSKYSAVIIDEAHERTLNTDIMIGMLSRVVEKRRELSAKQPDNHKPLKLIIMSATLSYSSFTKNATLFRKGTPPVVNVEGRQYPVTTHFSRRTQADYVEEMFQKVSKGHRKLPSGAMLVFLTSQSEISRLIRQLRRSLPSTEDTDNGTHPTMRTSSSEAQIDHDDIILDDPEDVDFIEGLDDYREDDEEDSEFEIGEPAEQRSKIHILPLYSQLPSKEQMRVFEAPPEGSRLIVVATNVAETSLTIPNIRYVFDCGRAKQKRIQESTGVETFRIDWISKASADQRQGRAGRTGPGHCYRLYSSAMYESFAESEPPEIQRTSLDGAVLQLKAMGIPNVLTFPFPTPPEKSKLVEADRVLRALGATLDGQITDTGRALSLYPLAPRLARILILATRNKCVDHAIALVSVLATPEIFKDELQLGFAHLNSDQTETPFHEKERLAELKKTHDSFHKYCARLDRTSDAIKRLVALIDFQKDPTNEHFHVFTNTKALQEALALRHQLCALVSAHRPDTVRRVTLDDRLKEPSSRQVEMLREVAAAGYIDQIAIRADLSPTPPDLGRTPKRAIDVPYITLLPSSGLRDNGKGAYLHAADQDERRREDASKYVYLHPSSVLSHATNTSKLPQYVVYSHLKAPSNPDPGSGRVPKTRMFALGPISAPQIINLAKGTSLIQESKPLGLKIDSLPRGADGLERRACWNQLYLVGKAGDQGWPLPPPRKVLQKRVLGKGWLTEEVLA